jgi:hypothetical protein
LNQRNWSIGPITIGTIVSRRVCVGHGVSNQVSEVTFTKAAVGVIQKYLELVKIRKERYRSDDKKNSPSISPQFLFAVLLFLDDTSPTVSTHRHL